MKTLGGYELLEKISVGGMAEIFLARKQGVSGFERLFAVKCIRPALSKDEEFIRMFIDEARITGQLSHANIAQTYDLGQDQGVYFIAMEYVSGIDLLAVFRELDAQGLKMPVAMAGYIVGQACLGLHAAHTFKDELGTPMLIVHRDCSPQNIQISFQGEVKVIDFGIAKAEERVSQTQIGVRKGKFRYMSPEQVSGQEVDHRSDVFSIGTVLWECLGGRPAFDGDSDFDVAKQVRVVSIPDLRAFNPQISDKLNQLVTTAMSLHPDDRIQSCDELFSRLRSILAENGLLVSPREVGDWLRQLVPQQFERETQRVETLTQTPIEKSKLSLIQPLGEAPAEGTRVLRPKTIQTEEP